MMPIVELIRLEESETYGTFGVLKVSKEVFCVTLEPADRLNQPNISCIPAQQYICRRHYSKTFGDTFQVMSVPGRDAILFHPGNRVSDTLGCILLARHYGKLRGDRAVLNSGNTFREFMGLMDGVHQFHLTLREVY